MMGQPKTNATAISFAGAVGNRLRWCPYAISYPSQTSTLNQVHYFYGFGVTDKPTNPDWYAIVIYSRRSYQTPPAPRY